MSKVRYVMKVLRQTGILSLGRLGQEIGLSSGTSLSA